MNTLVLGGSRNVAYEASIRLLANGAKITYLLRRPDTFDNDEQIKRYQQAGQVKISVGDATREDDVRNAWTMAADEGGGHIDFVLFSIGAITKFTKKGFAINPPNLVSICMLNLLTTWPKDMTPQPKLIAVTSNGLTKKSHNALPFLLKPLYGIMLRSPHNDKLGVERLLFQVMGKPSEDEPNATILPVDWKTRIGSDMTLQDVIVVRPALLTDGACRAEEKGDKAYRTGPEDMANAWTISRKDVAYFIVKALEDFEQYKGRCVTVAY